ncbi:mitochondrial ribosomal protein S5 [Rhodnius prolixus]
MNLASISKISTHILCHTTKNNVSAFSLLSVPILNFNNFVRHTSFFTKQSGEQLWKGVTCVSNAGKKRGRGQGGRRKVAKDLNKGQIIGLGKLRMLWPGLTSPVIRGKELVEQIRLADDPDHDLKLIKLRDKMGVFRRLRLLPHERGWSGNRLPGTSVGPPDRIGDEHFDGFDTKVLEMKSVFNMTGNMGRKKQMSIFVVTGNGAGLAGFGLGKAMEVKAALKSAKNRAGQRLMFVERYKNHTVYHDFFSQFGKTKLYVSMKPEGYGLVCHRAIASACQVIGITDLHARLEGSHNLQHIVKAFFLGLLRQKTHVQLAKETGRNVVEFRTENDNFPSILASPPTKNPTKEVQEFKQYVLDGRVILQRKKFPPFYTKLPGWQTHLKKTLRFRNHENVRITLKSLPSHFQN